MTHSIQLEPGARRDTIRAALARTSAREIALVFTLGAACALADPAELGALREHCDAAGVRVVIIGGDKTLRARAVTAGFAAATTLEEWDTSSHKAVRPAARSWGPRSGKRGTGAPPPAAVHMMGTEQPCDEEDTGDLYEPGGGDPPSYVAELVAADEALSPPRRHVEVPTVPLRRSRTTRKLADSLRDLVREREALERAHEAYEEQITETIRTSAAMAGVQRGEPESSDGPLEADGS